jgi:hypothetical protein
MLNRKIFFFYLILSFNIYPQISLTGVGTYVQDFNSLSDSGTSALLPSGWFFEETGNNSDSLYNAGTGSDNTGDTYSFGSEGESDRSLGTLRDNNLVSIIGAQFINNTGSEITQLPINYTGEQWRRGLSLGADRLDFQYSTDAADFNSGSWIDVDELDFSSQNLFLLGNALNGNLQPNKEEISFIITALNIADGDTFWIRWIDLNLTGLTNNDDGLSIDDFSIDQTALPVELVSFTGSFLNNSIILKWQTITEVDNFGFEIERRISNDPDNKLSFEKIGFVKGSGNSNSPKNYRYEDKNFSVYGTYLYRLKQIDTDGDFAFSTIIEVKFTPPDKLSLNQNYPNPFNPFTKIIYSIPAGETNIIEEWPVSLKIYNVLGNEVATLVNENKVPGVYVAEFDGTNFPSGVYYYKLETAGSTEVKKMLLLK